MRVSMLFTRGRRNKKNSYRSENPVLKYLECQPFEDVLIFSDLYLNSLIFEGGAREYIQYAV